MSGWHLFNVTCGTEQAPRAKDGTAGRFERALEGGLIRYEVAGAGPILLA